MSVSRRTLRLKEISDIITAIPIRSQAELLHILATRGFAVTQASLSRDLKSLGIRKSKSKRDEGCYISGNQEKEQPETGVYDDPSASTGILTFDISGNIAVLKTRNGYAGGVAYDIDLLHSPLVLGTIAGGDTVFAALAAGASRKEVLTLFGRLLPTRVLEQYFTRKNQSAAAREAAYSDD